MLTEKYKIKGWICRTGQSQVMRYEGMIYRPPSEARSLIVQVTVGCSHNRCTFCSMYKDKMFRIKSREEIFADLEDAAEIYGRFPIRIFLADGDALMLKTDFLLEILEKIEALFPLSERTTVYGSAADILRKSPEELKSLKAAGLAMVYMGIESGDDAILQKVRKGISSEEMVLAGGRLKDAGIALSATLIAGLGGKERLREHAEASAGIITRIKPEYVGYLTLLLEEGCPMLEEVRSGKMQLLTPDESLEELEIFLKNVDSEGTVFRATHASNYLSLRGTLNADIGSMIGEINEARREKNFRPEHWRGL